MAGDGRVPPGSVLAGFAATQFAVLVAMVQTAPPSKYSTLAILSSSIALPFLLMSWIIIRDSKSRGIAITPGLSAITLAACLIGVLSIVFMIMYVDFGAGLVFAGASLAALLFGYVYETKNTTKRP